MTEIAKSLRWIRNVYEELEFKLGPLPLCIDNQGTMFLASNPAQEGQTKHIRIPEHYIHEAVELEDQVTLCSHQSAVHRHLHEEPWKTKIPRGKKHSLTFKIQDGVR